MPVQRAKDLYKKYERWVPIAFFGFGFVFDAITLQRIDDPLVILQQAVCLLVSAALIGVELIETIREVPPPPILRRAWPYREAFLHFLLGTLLNSYTIFYFKSASTITSFLFIALLIVLLILNEFKRFGRSQARVHIAFLSLCLISYLISLSPILLGFIGMIPFLSAVAASCALWYCYFRLLKPLLSAKPELLRSHVVAPFVGIHVAFIALYFAQLIPPVPLSVSYMGIFNDIKKENGAYHLSYTRPWWKFWQHGDQTFRARPGDTIYCFARVFSPARFKDQLQVRWLYQDERRGWLPADAIPMSIVGGRDEGFRGVTKKNNYQPGDWRVQIETMDNREVGRIDFTVEADVSTEPREPKTIID